MTTKTVLRSSSAHTVAHAAARFATALFLCLVGALAHAQSCTPPTPRTDPGTGFTPFGTYERTLARGGNSGPAWEWAVGTDTESGQKVQGSLDWISGKAYSWKVINSGTGSEVLEIRDAGTLVLSLTYPSGMDAGNALELQVSTNPSIGSDTTIAASITSLNGYGVSGAVSQTGNGTQAAQTLYVYFPPMQQGFTAEGTVSLTYPANLPTGSRVQFTVRAGTIPCSSGGNPPTVSITAPTANAVFTAPASITVTADAQDTDGTVTEVAFYANGNPIGTTTTSPYTIQWTNVPAGAYSLTAVATDNDGLQSTSAAVPITVNAVKALYFIHVDHLNTPRLIADANGTTVWRWDQAEPFGDNVANEDPDGNSVAFSYPQRLPGQYYDAETVLYYNYFRDYDPSLGRYVRSDPIGLRGGWNTYLYGGGNPVSLTDPTGQFVTIVLAGIGLTTSFFVGFEAGQLAVGTFGGLFGLGESASQAYTGVLSCVDTASCGAAQTAVRNLVPQTAETAKSAAELIYNAPTRKLIEEGAKAATERASKDYCPVPSR